MKTNQNAAGDAPMPPAGSAQALKAARQKGARTGGGWTDADRRAMQDAFQVPVVETIPGSGDDLQVHQAGRHRLRGDGAAQVL